MTLADLVFGVPCSTLPARDRALMIERELREFDETAYALREKLDDEEGNTAEQQERGDKLFEALETLLEAFDDSATVGNMVVPSPAHEAAGKTLKAAIEAARKVLEKHGS